MANINESIEQLTASLQELMAHTYNHITDAEPVTSGKVPDQDLRISGEVEAFVESTRAYAEKTKHISVGTY